MIDSVNDRGSRAGSLMSSQLVAAYIRSSFCLCCLTCSRIVNIDVNVSFDVCFFESIRGSHENSVAGKSCRRIAHYAYQQIERVKRRCCATEQPCRRRESPNSPFSRHNPTGKRRRAESISAVAGVSGVGFCAASSSRYSHTVRLTSAASENASRLTLFLLLAFANTCLPSTDRCLPLTRL